MTSLFHPAQCLQGWSLLELVSELHSLLRLRRIFHCVLCITFVYPLICQWACGLFPPCDLLWIMLLWTRMCKYLSSSFGFFGWMAESSGKFHVSVFEDSPDSFPQQRRRFVFPPAFPPAMHSVQISEEGMVPSKWHLQTMLKHVPLQGNLSRLNLKAILMKSVLVFNLPFEVLGISSINRRAAARRVKSATSLECPSVAGKVRGWSGRSGEHADLGAAEPLTLSR